MTKNPNPKLGLKLFASCACIVGFFALNVAKTMFDSKQLSEDQVQTIKTWASEGAQLADIQKRMEGELGFRLTYMDTRFLVLDLELEIISASADLDEKPDEVEVQVDPELEALSEDDLEILPPPPAAAGPVRVSVDQIARPGMMVNGRVVFPDGQGGGWYVDEMGRLGIEPDMAGYRPSEADLMAFQRELQTVMDKH